jgi:hypothetical protein
LPSRNDISPSDCYRFTTMQTLLDLVKYGIAGWAIGTALYIIIREAVRDGRKLG